MIDLGEKQLEMLDKNTATNKHPSEFLWLVIVLVIIEGFLNTVLIAFACQAGENAKVRIFCVRHGIRGSRLCTAGASRQCPTHIQTILRLIALCYTSLENEANNTFGSRRTKKYKPFNDIFPLAAATNTKVWIASDRPIVFFEMTSSTTLVTFSFPR
jgi:hypothetical protein